MIRPGRDDGENSWSNPDTNCEQRYPDCFTDFTINHKISSGEAVSLLTRSGHVLAVIERKRLDSILSGTIPRPWDQPGEEPSLAECLAHAASNGQYPTEPYGGYYRYPDVLLPNVLISVDMAPWNTQFHYNKLSTYGGYRHCEDGTYWCGVTWDAYYKNGWNYKISYLHTYYEFIKCTTTCEIDQENPDELGMCVPEPGWDWDPNANDGDGGYIYHCEFEEQEPECIELSKYGRSGVYIESKSVKYESCDVEYDTRTAKNVILEMTVPDTSGSYKECLTGKNVHAYKNISSKMTIIDPNTGIGTDVKMYVSDSNIYRIPLSLKKINGKNDMTVGIDFDFKQKGIYTGPLNIKFRLIENDADLEYCNEIVYTGSGNGNTCVTKDDTCCEYFDDNYEKWNEKAEGSCTYFFRETPMLF